MSGIYIKGMEMPTSCGDCELCACYVYEDGTEEYYRCPITMYPIHDFDERHEHCPLVPVPDHGRLIDADALHYSRVAIWHNDSTMPMGGYVGGMNAVVMSAEINNAPTIIPAEEADHA